jgi:glycosyltransferase involved in cell wall biosynthesis
LPYPTKKAKFLTKTFFKNASGGFLLYGDNAKDTMIREGFSEKKLYVVYNSLDYERQIKLREAQNSGDIYTKHFRNSDPVIIFIGRLQREKKLEMIIEAQKRLIKGGNNINVVFVGTGEMEGLLKSIQEEYGLTNRIWFFGPCYEEEQIARLIYNATLTVSPGDIGLTAIHSLTYGTPVITHSSYRKHGPEYEAITKGETGDFFEENNVTELVDKIARWTDFLRVHREKARAACYSKIDLHYNPKFQIQLLKSVLK